MAMELRLFVCFRDNYGVLLHDTVSGATAAIDAPEAAPVEAALKKTGWRLTDILVTHHHADHTAGIGELKGQHQCRVVAPRPEALRAETVGDPGDRQRLEAGPERLPLVLARLSGQRHLESIAAHH